MVFYFTATGNSLYAARQLDDELTSIAHELRKPAAERHYQADAIGIVVPLYEFDLPRPVEEFILGSTFDTDYFYVISTYGMHNGGIAERVSARLEAAGRHVDYYNTVIMLDNAINVFDMDEQRKLDPEKKVDEQLAAVRADIDARRHYIQPAEQEEVDFYEGYMKNPFDLHPSADEPLYRVEDSCIGCGTCSRGPAAGGSRPSRPRGRRALPRRSTASSAPRCSPRRPARSHPCFSAYSPATTFSSARSAQSPTACAARSAGFHSTWRR